MNPFEVTRELDKREEPMFFDPQALQRKMITEAVWLVLKTVFLAVVAGTAFWFGCHLVVR